MRRFFWVALGIVVQLASAAAVRAQSCPTPVITQIGGSNPSCANATITLDAGLGATYLWSNGATTRIISDAPSITTTYTVTVTDSGGCAATSAPLTMTVTGTPAAPSMTTDVATVCPGASVVASINSPAEGGSWSDVQWSFTNGTLVATGVTPAGNNTIARVTATGNGPVGLTATAIDSSGCAAPAVTGQVPIRVIAAPAMTTDVSSVCPGGSVVASVSAPVEGGSWADVQWNVTNGTIVAWAVTPAGNNTIVRVTATGDGPVGLTATGIDSSGCVAPPVAAQVPIRVIAAPTMAADASVCAGGSAVASISAPAEGGTWADVVWNVTNGTIVAWAVTPAGNNTMVRVMPSGNGPVGLTATARNAGGCTASVSGVIPLRTIASPTITTDVTAVCAGSDVVASINGSADGSTWADVQWSATNAMIISEGSTPAGYNTIVRVTANGAGPVGLTVTVRDSNGCTATASTGVPLRTIQQPSMGLSGAPVCSGALAGAFIGNPVEGGTWSTIHWTVTNATLDNGTTEMDTTQTSVSVRATGGGPIHVTATARDAYGCSATVSEDIPLASPSATITPSGPTTFCAGGSVTLSAPAGYTYTWSNGATTQSITTTNSGTWSVTVTDATGCSATSAGVAVTVLPLPDSTFQVANATKYNAMPGQPQQAEIAGHATSSTTYKFCDPIDVNLIPNALHPGGPSLTYLWSTGATAPGIEVTTPGTYSLTVTDTNGCSSTSSVTLIQKQRPTLTITPSGSTVICPTGGAVTLTASAADSYQWSTGATTQSIVAMAPDTYMVTATVNGCSNGASINVTQYQATITPSGPTAFCAGSVTLSASPADSYLWTTGATTQSITVSTYGSYAVTETIAGCTITSASVTVDAGPSAVEITPTGVPTVCPETLMTFHANVSGGGQLSYQWTDDAGTIVSGADTADVTIRAPYGSPGYHQLNLTVTSAGGCRVTSSRYFAVLNSQKPVINGPNTICGTEPIYLWVPGNTFLWSTGETTQTIAVTQPGTYAVTVTDSNGCTGTSDPFVVTSAEPPATPTITAGGPTTFCQGLYGSVALTSSPATSYLWSTGETTQSITVYTSGNYTVTVTNASSCSATSAAMTVTAVPYPSTTITASGPTRFCAGGSVTLTAPSGAGYTYHWSTGATTQSIVATQAGNFTVDVTNSFGCTLTSAPATVDLMANPPVPVITANGPTSFCSAGSVTLTAPSGYSYRWSNGATMQSIIVSTAGSWTVTVYNDSGCGTTSDPLTTTILPPPPQPVVTADGPLTFCAGGHVTLTSSPGATYHWIPTNDRTQSITVWQSGSYAVIVTDANGCASASAWVVVTATVAATPTITASGPTTFCYGGSVTLTSSPAASYRWSDGETTQSIQPTISGSYHVTITDANGCSATSADTVVTVNPKPNALITASGPTALCEGGSVTLTVSDAGATYLWSNGATTQSITVAETGNYSVTVTNTSGCSNTSAPVAVTVNPLPVVTITPSGPTTFCYGGTVTLTASGGVSYLWSNGATSPSITVGQSGTYTVTGTTSSNCSATSAPVTVTVDQLAKPTITAGGPTTFCQGGSVTLTSSPAASYRWSNLATTQSITVNQTGGYQVTITDANGCMQSSDVVQVTVNPLPVVTISGQSWFCAGGSTTLTASGGTSYLWSNGVTTPSATFTQPGNYTVTVTSDSGCSSTVPVSVALYALPAATITASGPTTFCDGGSVTLTASAGYTYLWSNGATTQSITVTRSGAYTVTTTGAGGCSATSDVTTVTVNPLPSATIAAGGPTTFCAGGSVTLSAPAGYTYSWSNGATTQSIVVVQSGTFNVTVTDPNGCSATSAATTVTVNPIPATPTITASGPTTLCNGGSVTLTAPAGYTYLWSTGETTQSINVTASGSFSVTITDGNGCSATSAPTTVNEHPDTPVITASGSTDICPGTSVTLTAPAGYTYLWSNGARTQSINVNQAGNYTVTIKDGTGCTATSAPVTVTVKTKTSIKQPSNQSIHVGDTTTLTVVATGTNLRYQWYSGKKGDTSTPLGTSASQTVGPYSVKATYYFWVRVTGDCGTADSNTINVTVN